MRNNINTYATTTAYNADTNKDYPNVSYIQGTDEVKWVKDDPVHIVCKYNVTSTSSATTLLNSNSGITYQVIDGVQQQSVQTTYTFDTLGEHIVKYKLSGTSIANNFRNCRKLTSVTIPEGVTSIGTQTFQNCSGLTSVTIPSGVTFIGSYAFDSCSGLTSITIPSGVTSISDNAFRSCSGFTSVTIPDSVTSIGQNAFDSCSGLTSITIPSGVTSISDNAFYGCTGLTSVTIPDSVTSIGSGAFENCRGLTSVTIPNSVTTLGGQAFRGCRGLTSVTIGNGMTNLGGSTFHECTSITSVTIQATTPPTLGNIYSFSGSYPIYVPAESVNAYKTATNWSTYASRLQEYRQYQQHN